MAGVAKKVEPMFSEIRSMVALENVTVSGLDHIPAKNRIVKAERKLQLQFEAVLDKELHEVVKHPSLGRFSIQTDEHSFVVEENQAYFEGYNFLDPNDQTFTINISAMRDANEQEGYMRLAIPIAKSYWVHNLHTYAVQTERSLFGGLMILKFEEGEVHVYYVTDGETKQQCLIVEPQYVVSKEKLFNIHYAVAIGLGIITGTACFGEAYLLVSEDLDFESYRAVSYYSLRETVHSQYTTFTTNMYWVEMLLKMGKYNGYALEMVVDEKGEVKRGLVDWLYVETYGKIIENMYKFPEIARAAVILLDGTNKALDYQAALYAVALETLCTKLKAVFGMSFSGIIKDKGTWTRIRKPLTKAFRESCSPFEIEKLNEISNTDKFKLVIDKLGLKRSLSDDEALEQRNNLLHGELVEKTAEDSTDFDDMYYYSLVLHRLCTAIIFKFAGYHGYLVNNAVLMDMKVACERKEPVLIEI